MEEPTRFIRLEVTNRASQDPNDHPWSIQDEELRRILEAVTVKLRTPHSRGNKFGYMDVSHLPDSSPAFSPDQLSFLVKHLSHALQQATPLEEAFFYFEHTLSQDTALLTSGSAFLQKRRLHILMSNFRIPTIEQEEALQARAYPLTVLTVPEYDLIPGSKGTVRVNSGWEALLLDLPQEMLFEVEKTQKVDQPLKPFNDQPLVTNFPKELRLREKLQELERVKQEGLITQEEFQTLRSRLLDAY